MPRVRFAGWSTDFVLCPFGGSEYVRMTACSKATADGFALGAEDWLDSDTDTLTYTCVEDGCGASEDCRQAGTLKVVTLEAAPEASDWEAGDFVVVKITRDITVSDNLASNFHVGTLQLLYPKQ